VTAAETRDVMTAAEAAEVVTSPVYDNVTSVTSVFERYSWVGLLAVHGPTALQVSCSCRLSLLLTPKHFLCFRLQSGE